MDLTDRLEILCDIGPFPEPGSVECAAVCVGGLYGLGWRGYLYAIDALLGHIRGER